MKHILLTVVMLGLSACASYTKEQCQNMNWGQLGSNAAMNGQTLEEREAHYREECEKEHGVKVNTQQLTEGHTTGLNYFCSASSGYSFGRTGGVYKNNCPAEKVQEFTSKYYHGRSEFLEDEVSSLRSKVSSLESELSSAESDLRSCKSDSN